jgi:hypothetical protein
MNSSIGITTGLPSISGINNFNLCVFYSPIIVVILVVAFSLVFQSIKGIIYLVIILLMTVLRQFIYMKTEADAITSSVCNIVSFGKYGNSSLSAFIFAFTILYLILPMITENEFNVWLFVGLLFYFSLDLFTRYYYKCLNGADYLMNVVVGAGLGAFWWWIVGLAGNGKYLFFNEFSSNKETCSLPSKQQFKCSIMKNGQEIAQIE